MSIRYDSWLNRDNLRQSAAIKERMKPSLRELLAESHIAAVAIAVLLLWSLDSGFRALWRPLSHVLGFLFTAVAILDMPYFSFGLEERVILITTFFYLLAALISLAAAWLLSHSVYGRSPLRSLSTYRAKLTRSKNA
jgi:hypothetical protein